MHDLVTLLVVELVPWNSHGTERNIPWCSVPFRVLVTPIAPRVGQFELIQFQIPDTNAQAYVPAKFPHKCKQL